MAKKEITKKQKLILLLIYTFRFINSKQIQEFLNHKDHRRINSWLKDLVTKEYITRDFKFVYGTLTKPAVFSLSIKGRKYIREEFTYHFPKYLKRIARDTKASKSLKIRCQLIADWYLMFFSPRLEKGLWTDREEKKGQKENTGIGIIDSLLHALTTEREEKSLQQNIVYFFTPSFFPDFILLQKLKPDGYMKLRNEDGTYHGLLFVIDSYIPEFLLRHTIKRIFDTLDEERWEDDTMYELDLYFLCPNNKISIYLKKFFTQYLQNYYSKTPLRVRSTTRDLLYARKNGNANKTGWEISSSDGV